MFYKNIVHDSWCDMCDDFLDTSLKKEVLIPSNIDNTSIEIKTEKQYFTINEVLEIDCIKKEICEIELLKYQIYVTGQLKKHVSSCIDNSENYDIDSLMLKLRWLEKTSLYLAKKKLQKDIRFKKKQDYIQRNSYDFCEMGSKCINKN